MELESKGFPVPQGFAVLAEPKQEQEWLPLFSWWQQQGQPKVAARSSAQGEDGAENSFAGQFITILQISNEAELKSAVKKCFKAVHQKNSVDYTKHFSQNTVQMRVYVQRMIQSEFSGVFFSKDPRGTENSWLVEVVHGQGEQLVSGQVTPVRFSKDQTENYLNRPHFENWKKSYIDEIAIWGEKVEKHLGYSVDMEWAIDADSKFWILQARPITTFAGMTQKRRWIEEEWSQLNSIYTNEDSWDGQLFAEWTGLPSEMTFDLWRRTFSKGKAFDLALQRIGYKGIDPAQKKQINSKSTADSEEILERIFGRCYLNLKKVLPIYFGEAPYVIKLKPRPHLNFNLKKITIRNLLNAPPGWWRMIRVAWNVQTRRHEFAASILHNIENQDFAKKSSFELYHQIQNLNYVEVQDNLNKNLELITTDVFQPTFLVTLLIESTYQGILALLKKDFGDKKANELGQLALGCGLSTVTLEMQSELSAVKDSENLWKSFIAKYGHRGAGELDLIHPRWIEFKDNPNKNINVPLVSLNTENQQGLSVHIQQLGMLRRETLKQEIEQLHFLLQTREKIKMQTMKLYSQIRWSLLRLAAELDISAQDIFWLNFDEVKKIITDKKYLNQINFAERKEKIKSCLSIDLPQSFSFMEMKQILNGEATSKESVLQGSNLSTGICQGRVHLVIDPDSEDLSRWDEDTILVAEATDPSWTALFARAKGIVVSRGGVLSHCAIVAREMGRPAVGEIQGATHVLKEGEHVWVDGTHGIVRRDI